MSTKVWLNGLFTRSWTLADDTEVRSVAFEDGLFNSDYGKDCSRTSPEEGLVLIDTFFVTA